MVVNDYLSLGGGLSLSKMEGTRSLLKIEQDNLYMRVNSELSSPKLNIGQTKTSGFLGISSELLISNNKETVTGTNLVKVANKEIDAKTELYAGAQNTYLSANEKTKIDTKVYATFYPDWNNVASTDNKVLALDSVVFKSGVSQQITDNTRALIDTAVIMKNYGTSMVVKLAMENEKQGSRYVAGVATPLTRDMPTYLPGGEKRAFVGVEKGNEKMMFSIMYERNFDNRSNNLMIKGEVRF